MISKDLFNGNILSSSRNAFDVKAKKTVNMDDLVYGYSGNQLKKVEDAGSSSGFKNGASLDTEYLYDANGNMTRDLNKGIKDIKYNELNLPESISFADGRKISYIYSAAGEKLQNIVGGKTISYCGGFVYEDGKLSYILNSEGRYVVNGSDGVYEYNICDHLGNVRAVVDGAGTVKQQSNYYPFGGVFAQAGSPDNKYLYNGKEKQEGTDWLDYGARMYSADLGRFMTVDRFAEKYSKITPYHYCANDPIKHIDVNGDSIQIAQRDRNRFNKILSDAFGEKASDFSYSKDGKLLYNGNTKGLSKIQKKLLTGFKNVICEENITNLIFGSSAGVKLNNGNVFTAQASSGGGGIAILIGESSVSENTILVDPDNNNVNTSMNVFTVTDAYFKSPIDPSNGARFIRKTIKNSVASTTFHEIGHVIYKGRTQDHVIKYENYIRKILGLPKRPNDETHNKTIN